jgi:hypothetical protein
MYENQGRFAEAEPLFRRALTIDERAFGSDRPNSGSALTNLAGLYLHQGRYAEAEPLIIRAIAIHEKSLGPNHPTVGADLSTLAQMYYLQGRYADAEPLIKRALAIDEKALGPDHPYVGEFLNDLAALYFAEGDWVRATDFLRRGTAVIARRALHGTQGVGQAVTGKRRDENLLSSIAFSLAIKAESRLPLEKHGDTGLPHETFQTAQGVQSSEAPESLAQMAVRGGNGSPLAGLVRERQDLVAEWQRRDQMRSASIAQASDQRNREAETGNLARLSSIDDRIAIIDKELKRGTYTRCCRTTTQRTCFFGGQICRPPTP